MSHDRPMLRRKVLAGLVPALVVAGALPLLAPTCGDPQPGVKTFARSSLIIPMDVCYQYQTDQVRTSYTPASCPQAVDPGDVIKAYGLVYQLIRNNIAVYWVIAHDKSAVTGIDLTLQYDNGAPVLRYDWTTGQPGQAATSSPKIDYRGGPFVVDGSDYAKASAILQQYAGTFRNVKVHVSNVAFQADVAKTMAGGWSAGGAVAPKLALLDIGSSGAGAKNSEVVIQGYLRNAGLDTAGAAGTATGTHGQIYDRLFMSDFQPDASGDWKTSNLYKNGYQVLWVPHWAAPSSCSDCPPGTSCTCNVKYDPAVIAKSLATIGAFSAAGGDVFAECAGLGSFEGVFSGTGTTTFSSVYKSGDPSTHFQTEATPGFWINKSVAAAAFPPPNNFASPLLQLGDYPFIPVSGAIQNYKASDYRPETVRLISDAGDPNYDVFTLVPRAASHGSVVYMGGHSYSGTDGNFEIGGTRLVLNTLFNLGASCISSGVGCNTGLPGVCGQGVMACSGGEQACTQSNLPSPEVCDGLDNDCNGLVDDGLDTACYDGPPGSLDGTGKPRGTCRSGVSTCARRADGSYGMTACAGEVLPSGEVCNGLDDDCDGQTDESLSQVCYTGPSDTVDPQTGAPRGECRAGTQSCAGGSWGACAGGLVLPAAEFCGGDNTGNGRDENCNGLIDEGCICTVGVTPDRSCYGGPTGTAGVGACRAGSQACTSSGWGTCVGEVQPRPEVCGNEVDDDCNGVKDDPTLCNLCPPAGDPSLVCLVPGATRVNPTPANPAGVPAGLCRDGVRSCADGLLGACAGLIQPSPEICDGKDNDCNTLVDDGAQCGDGFSCVHGVCVTSTCGVESQCPLGYDCVAGRCALGTCNGSICADGLSCEYGGCIDPCTGVTCGDGAVCASGACTGGSCYFAGCPDGQLCRSGACVADPCSTVSCPAGTFCRSGDCVQACVFQSCKAGEKCGPDGFCEPDACAGKTCPTGQLCSGGACQADPCVGLGCGTGQTCSDGACVDDPCAGIDCPAGVCSNGQCYASSALGPPPPKQKDSPGGCGCGSGDASPLAGLLLVLAIPLARRRRGAARPGLGSGPALLLLAVALLAAACKKEDPFDPATCAETCGEARCVDVQTDPAHCGRCDSICGAGQVCVDAVCGPSAAVAPYLRTLSPGSAPKGGAAPAQIALAGDRFAAGATLRTVSPYGSRTYPACDPGGGSGACLHVSDAGHAEVGLDLRDSPTTELELRIVNPDRVISNAREFGVVTPTPLVTALTPPSAQVGTISSVEISGSGFMASSQCHLAATGYAEQALPTTQGPTSVTCALDPALPPGNYQLWVVNEGTLASAHLPFTLSSGVPAISRIAPNAGEESAVVSFSILGTGFDAATKVLYEIGGTASEIPGVALYGPTELFVPQYRLPSCTASPPCNGTDRIFVRNAAGSSGKMPFYRGAAPAQVLSLTVTPQPLTQGDTATFVFTGSSMPTTAGTVVEIHPPVSQAFTAPATVAGAGASMTATAAGVSLAGHEEGLYTAELKFASGASSSSFPFRVFSNVAVLASATPSGGAQGATVPTLTLKGSNFRAGAELKLLAGPSSSPTAVQVKSTVYTPPDTLTVAGLQISDATSGNVSLATGVYALVVVNPGAAASNGVSFSVTPGAPTVAANGVSPVSARQQETPVTVTITGTNFAAPDAGGNGGSTLMVAGWDANGVAITPGFVPAPGTVTVVSSTQLRVQLDTRAGVPGTYRIAVWNPGGNPPPQRSDAGRDPQTLPSFQILP